MISWQSFALTAASFDDNYEALIALAPSKVVWQGIPEDFSTVAAAPSSWSRDGEGVPFVPYMSNEAQEETGLDNRHQASLTNTQAAMQATIKAENISIPMLLLSGGADKSWPAASTGEEVCQRAGDNCTHISYREGDHLLSNYQVTMFAEIRKFLDNLN